MGRNYVVLRRSPDWRTFDLRETRAFLRQFSGMSEDMIIRFAEIWDAAFEVDFLGYRQAMKDLSLELAHGVRGATIVDHSTVGMIDVADDDLLFFTDDDDWTAPCLFEPLRAAGDPGDGWMWRSIFVGKLFSDTPYEKGGAPLVQERPASDVVYTNNYAVSGAAWRRLGADRLLEHYSAQGALDAGQFRPRRSDAFLTAANKHLCCTVAIECNGRAPGVLDDLPRALGVVLAEGEAAAPGEAIQWISGPLARFTEINRRTLGQR